MEMARRILVQIGGKSFVGELDDTTITGKAIWEMLPLEGRGNKWGKEIYFSIPLELPEEDPKEVVEPGALAYWPPGHAFCIFWGPTPMSRSGECRPYSPVNVFGRLLGDLSELDVVEDLSVKVSRQED
jgi:hypothetical protein